MKIRLVAATIVAVALAVAASTASGASKATSITVWLQNDAQNGWADTVAAATKDFNKQHPGVDVKVEYQQWPDHLTKFDATLAGGNAPDVVEFGNTETVKYMANGVLADLSSQKASFPNSGTWLKGLKDSCTYNGKLFCVPYYAGARAVIYRTDFYKKAGIKSPPTTLDAFVADHQKLMKTFGKDANFSAFYFPGKNWYASMAFVYDWGGKIAITRQHKWVGALDSPQAVQALTTLKSIVDSTSRASKTTDESHPYPSVVFAKDKVASFVGNGWEWPYTLDDKVGKPALAPVMGAYPMPSHVKGRYMPTFLGGSDLGIPVTSKNKDLAADWIKSFTSTGEMTEIAKAGNIPNTTSLLKINAANPKLAPFAEAAKFSWFVPATPNWANVENANILQNMLVNIFTGKKSVKSAATDASKQITSILNASA
jgi:N,N'-diacetylchitobiose transport system substrate-binding protein